MSQAYASDSPPDSASPSSTECQHQPQPLVDNNDNNDDNNNNSSSNQKYDLPEVKEDKEGGLLEVRVAALAIGDGGIRAVFDMRDGCLSQLQLLRSNMGIGVVADDGGGEGGGGRVVDLLGSLGDDNSPEEGKAGEGDEEAGRKVMRILYRVFFSYWSSIGRLCLPSFRSPL